MKRHQIVGARHNAKPATGGIVCVFGCTKGAAYLCWVDTK
jgi:hypothetical protein